MQHVVTLDMTLPDIINITYTTRTLFTCDEDSLILIF